MRILLTTLLALFSSVAYAECRVNMDHSGYAIGGYDAVAYHNDGNPKEGKKKHKIEHEGAIWLFSNKKNKKAFAANPSRYVPAYGGFCAFGVSAGSKYSGSPQYWSIRGGRLYFQHNRGTQMMWKNDADRLIATADDKWPFLASTCE